LYTRNKKYKRNGEKMETVDDECRKGDRSSPGIGESFVFLKELNRKGSWGRDKPHGPKAGVSLPFLDADATRTVRVSSMENFRDPASTRS